MLNGRSEVKCRCKGTNRRNRSKGGHTINTAVGPFCIYKVFSSGLEAASTGLRCISMWPRSSQRKAIIRTHLLSETSSDYIGLVRLKGLEPTRIAAREPKSRMSTNSITGAYSVLKIAGAGNRAVNLHRGDST